MLAAWWSSFSDCVRGRDNDDRRISKLLGVEREMKICHNQPHLVPPMKLVVYEKLPTTPRRPPPSQLSQLVAQGKNMASRASHRASLSIRRSAPLRPSISAPRPIQPSKDLPLRRGLQYRPLELSIYLPENRLSDLPEFDEVAFNALGEIQMPKKALLRPKSAEIFTLPAGPVSPRNLTTSMVGERQLEYWQRHRSSSSVISTSRPPSAHDAFHSHPVSFNSLPGLAPQHQHRPSERITVLSPMQEEFSPASEQPTETIKFPAVTTETAAALLHSTPTQPVPNPTEIQRPFKLARPPTSNSYRSRSHSYSHTRTPSSTNRRVSQWLSRSTSTSTTSASPVPSPPQPALQTPPTQFYQLATTPPQLRHHSRHRTLSASTVSSSILSTADASMSVTSLTSMTTAPTATTAAPLHSRSSTVKSFSKNFHIVVDETDLASYPHPGSPEPIYAKRAEPVLPLRSPGIGVAF